MNSLSWMIYAAEVTGKIGGVALVVAIIALITIGICTIAFACYNSDNKYTWNKGRENKNVAGPARYLWVPALAFFVFAVSPSSPTIYMIAASETGEQIVKTPEAREMFDVLRQRIMEELKVEPK